MKYGKQVIPNLGIIQGILSNYFVHISDLHSDFNGVDSYDEYSESLRINISLIKSCIWSLYIVSELTFFGYFDGHTYWAKVSDNQYRFEESEQVR
ncbi:hypothetical protein GCM10008014_24310 [Paenibacillus silvae]|uniref:Uncharacterized protein n=1 Tax=Paenibacillus silvae TaxID=1325358 RepID=A0ABQ1ZAD1_9BACL|nr:hypothetical protein GCM10008014_24310 [Paenibacillus silvae]